jgi:hypothetical protein
MAERTTTLWDAQVSTRTDQARLPARTSRPVNFTKVPYTLTANDETESDTIAIMALPPGAIPRPEYSNVTCSADVGTALTIDIGTAENTDGWADGIVLDSGGKVECTSGTMPAWLARTELAADSGQEYVKVYATIMTGTTLTTTTILYFNLAWEYQG